MTSKGRRSQRTLRILRQGQQSQDVLNELGVLGVPVSPQSARGRKESWSSKVKSHEGYGDLVTTRSRRVLRKHYSGVRAFRTANENHEGYHHRPRPSTSFQTVRGKSRARRGRGFRNAAVDDGSPRAQSRREDLGSRQPPPGEPSPVRMRGSPAPVRTPASRKSPGYRAVHA